MQKKVVLNVRAEPSENVSEVTPSRTLENALLESRTSITFIIDLQSEKEYMPLSESFLYWVVQHTIHYLSYPYLF